jgi:hypothetical protein
MFNKICSALFWGAAMSVSVDICFKIVEKKIKFDPLFYRHIAFVLGFISGFSGKTIF